MSLFLAKKLDSVLTTLQLNFFRNYISTTLAKIWDTFSGTASDGFPKSKFVTFSHSSNWNNPSLVRLMLLTKLFLYCSLTVKVSMYDI